MLYFIFFFKQKTAYEMRISDWSSDVCSSDLKDRGVVPFIKVDQGLEDEARGVQLMKPMTRLDALIQKSLAAGMFGTKMRSVIKSADAEGIAAVVAQQCAYGRDRKSVV